MIVDSHVSCKTIIGNVSHVIFGANHLSMIDDCYSSHLMIIFSKFYVAFYIVDNHASCKTMISNVLHVIFGANHCYP